jgi:hypothetical protein
MPEKVTKEERKISLAIEKAREVKAKLHRNNIEPTQVNTLEAEEHLGEEVKRKEPNRENMANKIKIETGEGTHSGYGKAGDSYDYS